MKDSQKVKAQSILVVEDDAGLREALVDTLVLAQYNIQSAESAEEALAILNNNRDFDLIISDVNMGEMSGHDLLRHVRQHAPHIPVLLVTAYASISESVEAMREGAIDYLVKPFESKTLLDTVADYLGRHRADRDAPIAYSESSKQLLELARRVALSDSTVLLVGESGTGKEVLARYVHQQSPRANMPFIAINCAAIPENMLEAMLFGHEKGAYTGAHASAPGKFEQANGGTLLLDEISEMDLGLQAKLLRVLQEREVERLGGRKSIKLDVRVIATSNRDMRMEVGQGKFREDLYFRLSVLPLQWAPLRDRLEDIIPLAESLLRKHAVKQHRPNVRLSEDAKRKLTMYAWPGNVRELDNVMQRALILQTGSEIYAQDLGLEALSPYSEKPSFADTVAQHSRSLVTQLAETHTQSGVVGDGQVRRENFELDYRSQLPQDNHSQSSLHEAKVSEQESMLQEKPQDQGGVHLGEDLKKHEFEIIVKTLQEEKGSKKNTAKKLGISPRTLRYKLARLREIGYCIDAV